MKLLLDTHALLWFCEGNRLLSAAARSAIEDPNNECYVSHATAWEVAIKVSLGKLALLVDYDLIFSDFLQANNLSILSPAITHYETLIGLPKHHSDPFDRLIIAQAMKASHPFFALPVPSITAHALWL